MFGKMVCLSLVSIILSAALILIPACTSAPIAETTSPVAISTTPVNSPSQSPTETEFARILGYVPYSFLDKHDIWFSDLAKAKQVYGYEDVTSLDALAKLSQDQLRQLFFNIRGVPELQRTNNWMRPELASAIGFDAWMVDQTFFDDVVPPTNVSILKGSFDQNLITSDMVAQGYQKVDYGSFSYLSMNNDYSPGDLSKPISSEVLSAMNRVAVLGDTIVTAPATDLMTAILDAMSQKQETIIDDPVCRALVNSLGDVLSGVIIKADRVMNPGFAGGPPPFNFKVPSDWGILHQYNLAGMGFKDDGQDRYWVISLYYQDPTAASADASTLETRLNSYIFYTQLTPGAVQAFRPTPLTDEFEVGRPSVQPGPVGVFLKVSLHFKPETSSGVWVNAVHDLRDVLFLAPDPTPYLVK